MVASLNRRDFIKLVGSAGGALVLAVYLDACAPDATAIPTTIPPISTSTPEPRPPFEWSPNIYLKIDQDGILTVTAFRSEMGQGIRTATAMLVAEEVDVDWSSVRIEQAPADRKYGDQQTGGSVSISTYYYPLLVAGAAARQMLVQAAAQSWDVKAEECKTEPGYVIHPDGATKLSYGELVEPASKLEVPEKPKLKDKSQYKIVNTGLGHWDAPQIVTGKANYGLDIRVPGMLFAAIARCPYFGQGYTSYDDGDAKAVAGVKQVVPLDNRIAVVAENSWAAIRGRNALKVTWEQPDTLLDSQQMIANAVNSIKKVTKSGTLDATYEIPYEAHATMEPMNCTVHVHDGLCEVWVPTQNPQDVLRAVAMTVDVPQDQVTVHVPLIGGGFGRRLQTDYAVEAAQVSKAVNAPIQVLWTRDDDLQHDFYHPMAVQHAFVSLEKPKSPAIQVMRGASVVPTGAWRSVDEFDRAYSEQCFLDEMALALELDPLEMRRQIYQNTDRALGVINLAAEKSNWGQPLPDGQGRGLAYFATFGVTHVADVAEVAVGGDGRVYVKRVVCAVDCGKVVNPDNVAAQMQSGIAFGLTAALKAQTTLKDGRVQESNFHDYPLLRMDEMPLVEVYIIENDERPTGIGEMGVPPVAPAIANAVYAATGKRVRHIPIQPSDLAV
jgi:isoquinoline 1-oxidoreductase subunit beta